MNPPYREQRYMALQTIAENGLGQPVHRFRGITGWLTIRFTAASSYQRIKP